MARAGETRIRWFSFRTNGKTWRVVLTADALEVDRETAVGITHYEEREILIDVAQDRADIADTALHEIIHAVFGKHSPVGYATEEKAVACLTPRLLPVLVKLGFTLPPLPQGFRRLAARARKRPA